jgi:hypothetical protein
VYFLILLLVVIFFFILANRYTRKNPKQISLEDLIETVESFLQNKGGAYDWDDFLTFPLSDSEMNTFRIECAKIDWTTQAGKDKVRELLDALIGQAS